jgi:hypothetical protein
MKRLLTAAAIALAAGLAACATATPYQPATFTARGPQNGFYEQPLEGNRWRVGFAGNTVTGRQQVEDALLLRAAEITLQQGFDHFLAVNRATERDVRYQADPTFPSARYGGFGYSRFGSPYWSPYWRYHRSAFGWSRWDPFWGDPWFDRDYTIREIDRYEATAEIVMGRGAPQAGDPRAFDARQIVANLGPRIPRPQYQQGYGYQPGYAPAPMAPGYQTPGAYRTPAYPAPAPAYPRRY